MVRSEAILEAIGKSYFILQSKNKLNEAIPLILSLLGEATQVDRVYILKNYKAAGGELYFSQKFEWVADGIEPQIDFEELQNVPWSVFPIVAEKLSKNQVLNEVLTVESNGQVFYDTMSAQGILSFLFIPIMVDHQFWGLMGFDNCSTKDIYSNDQVAALHAFTSTLGYSVMAKRQKKKLLKAKASYSYLINNVNELIFKLDVDCNWIFVNKQWEKVTNFPQESIKGLHFSSSFKRENREEINILLNKLINHSLSEIKFEAELLINNNQTNWVKVQAKPQFDIDHKLTAITGSIIDIKREKEVLAKLEESVAQTNAIIDSVKDTLYTFSGDLEKVYFVSDNIKFLGLDKGRYSEDSNYWREVIHPEDRNIIQQELEKLKTDGTFDAIYRIINEEGKEIWIQDKAWVVKDGQHKILKVHGRYTDITELKIKELKLKSSEASLQKLNEMLQGVNETQKSFHVENDFRASLDVLLTKILEITGSKFGFIGEVLFDENSAPYLKTHTITNIAWSEETEKFYQENFRSGIEFRNLNTLFGKSLVSGELVISNNPTQDPRASGTPHGHPPLKKYMGVPVFKGEEFLGLMGFANKEDDYKPSDVELLQPLISGYANLIKAIRIQRQKNESDKLKEQSDRLYRLLSENTSDIIALHALDLKFEYVSPSIRKILGYSPEECIGNTPAQLFGVSKIQKKNLLPLKVYSTVVPHTHKLTGQTVMLETIITPLKDDKGLPYSFMSASRDVTERESVLEELKESLAREQELNQLKSRFISMTSHEFRTPLATIMSSTEILEIILGDLEDERLKSKTITHLDRINSQIKRLTGVIADLLILEKNAQDKIIVSQEQVSINHFLRNIVEHHFPDRAKKIKLHLPKVDRIISLDPSLLSHILNNLIDNALKYSESADLDPELSLFLHNEYYEIKIKDHGLGIPEDDQKYIFGSFFRAKNVRTIKGTGLGLNIVKELVEKIGGEITFNSKENKGTEFIILLPYVL